MSVELKRTMGLWDLVLFNVTAVVALRWLAIAARTGPSSLTLWLLAAVLFFLPQGLAVAYLANRYPEEGGIYRWTRRAFGDFHGFFCGWCYWISNLVFYPALLVFAAGAAAYILGPQYVGSTGAWLAGSARVPFVAGIDRFLPAAFGRVHPRWRTPHVAILTQGIAATFFLALAVPGGTIAETYLLLSELSVLVYFVPYLYLFSCFIRFRPKARAIQPDAQSHAIRIPGNGAGAWLAGGIGFVTTLVAILVSVIPSSAVTRPWLYEAKLLGGAALFFGSGVLLYWRSRAGAARPE